MSCFQTDQTPDFIHLPGTPGYAAGTLTYNLSVTQHPAAVATPTDAEQAAEAVRYARRRGWRVAPQATGHAPIPLVARAMDDVLLLRTGALTRITVDPATGVIRAGAGSVVLDVVNAAAAHGLTIRHGSASTVGLVGYLTGGGLGFYGRAHGLANEQLVAADLVTPDGQIVRVDDECDPDAMWALRGGRANIGLVTAIELRGDVQSPVVAGMMVWDAAQARDVMRAWRDWCADAPESVTTSCRLLRFPPLPGVPEVMLGRPVVAIDGAVLADQPEADRVLAPLRAIPPESDTFAPMDPTALPFVHMDPTEPIPALSSHRLLRELPDEAIEVFLQHGGATADTQLLSLELRQLGGALARPSGLGALDHIPGSFATFTVGVLAGPGSREEVTLAGEQLQQDLSAWASEQVYLSFADELVDTATGYQPDAFARLRRIRAERDPDRVFVANHSVDVTAGQVDLTALESTSTV